MINPHEGAAQLAGWHHEFVPGDAALPVLLMLHGTGGDEREMVALGHTPAPSATIVSPRGWVSEAGMARFFRRSPGDPFDFPDLGERIDELAALVRAALVESNSAGGESMRWATPTEPTPPRH